MKLHPDDVEFFEHIKVLGKMTAEKFGLGEVEIEYKRHANARIIGLCQPETRTIKLLIRLVKEGRYAVKRVSDGTLMFTLAHELAHLRIGPHGMEHDKLTKEIYQWLMYRKEVKNENISRAMQTL